uniref:N-acetyltransferase domain-containing protein n=1 Tax=Phaeomonas parva TaxID=124430 RepID=A0A7S1TY27_9STRA|mmetsp:Transcript_20698/g.62975  ORF Transcript_20698/g.62975 Transcript_20698/m.62975 type:complete len:261 (+) Transcript_20698:195-977(+)
MSDFLDAEGFHTEEDDPKKARENFQAQVVADVVASRPEIRVVSQAMCYRPVKTADFDEVVTVLNEAYSCEEEGAEAFREGDYINKRLLAELFLEGGVQGWVVEVARGFEIEKDGAILGACVFRTDGTSTRNGEVEGKLGSIRLMGVLPRYKGLLVGRRLLEKVEALCLEAGCVRTMACVPAPRRRLGAWLEDRDYYDTGRKVPYPAGALGHQLSKDDVVLKMYTKKLEPKPSMTQFEVDPEEAFDKVCAARRLPEPEPEP